MILRLLMQLFGRDNRHDFDLEHPLVGRSGLYRVVGSEHREITFTTYRCVRCGKTLAGISRQEMERLPAAMRYGCRPHPTPSRDEHPSPRTLDRAMRWFRWIASVIVWVIWWNSYNQGSTPFRNIWKPYLVTAGIYLVCEVIQGPSETAPRLEPRPQPNHRSSRDAR